MQTFGLTALAFISLVIVLLTGVSGPNAVTQPAPPTATTPVVPALPPGLFQPGPAVGERPVIPTLSTDQQEWLTALALSEPRVQHLTRGLPYELGSVAPWLTPRDLILLGGVVELRFGGPVDLAGEWLGLNYDCTDTHWPPYQTIPYEASVAGADRLNVFVALASEQVVGISTFPGGIVSGPTVTTDEEIWPRTCPGD